MTTKDPLPEKSLDHYPEDKNALPPYSFQKRYNQLKINEKLVLDI